MMKGFLKTFLAVNLSLYMAFAQSQEVYKAATEGNILPIAFKDENGLLIGLNVEIMNRIAELEEFKVEFFEATWEDIFAGIDSKRFDIAITDISYTDERNEKYTLSNPYLSAPSAIMVTNKHHEVKGIADLSSLRIGLMKDAKHKSVLETAGVQNIQEENSTFSLFKLLAQGKVDAILHDSIILEYFANAYAHTNLDFKIITYEAESKPESQLVFLMSKGNASLQGKVNRGIEQLKSSGELEKIKNKWLNFKN